MKPKYEHKIHRELARDLQLMKYEDSAREALIHRLGGKCSKCSTTDSDVLEIQSPKGLKARNFKDRLRWVSLPGFSLICGNCRVKCNTVTRRQRIKELTDMLLEQWKKEHNGKENEPSI